MTKVLKLGRNQNEAEIYNFMLNDDGYFEVSNTWSELYENNGDIENQDANHIKLIAKYLINNGFSRSGEHLLKNLNPLWETCKI